jgi:hypothetical protein
MSDIVTGMKLVQGTRLILPQVLTRLIRYKTGIASADTRLVGSLLLVLIPGACLYTILLT